MGPLVLPRCGVRRSLTGRGHSRRLLAGRAALALLAIICLGATSCSSVAKKDPPAPAPLASHTRLPAAATSVLTGTPDVIAESVAQDLFASAPVIVIASPSKSAEATAARQALQVHAPLLLTAAGPGQPVSAGTTTMALHTGARSASGSARAVAAMVSAVLRARVKALDPRLVLAVGIPAKVLAAQLPGVRAVTNPALLPATKAPAPLGQLALLVSPGDSAATLAAVTTARVAGAKVITVRGGDPRADPDVITALSAAPPQRVLAVGSGFGTAAQLASRITVAETGVQLPGGGQVLLPGHLLVALYGHPGAPSLGVLGQQGLSASITRAKQVAAQYRSLSHARVVLPALEIIATVAQASPGPDDEYSYESPVASLRPWVRRATAAGLYVILDLQPGRASLLAQAQKYQSLLKLPDVGLALDPEWKLQPGQLPLKQIGSVSISEVNSVVSWLAALTMRYRLPQKLLVLHQFQLSMIRGESRLNTRHDDLAILIHMDGQGTPSDKEQTWDTITKAAPSRVFFGWKNFYVKDHPMLTPRQTITRTPRLSMISYQ